MLSKLNQKYRHMRRFVLYLSSFIVLLTFFCCQKSDKQKIRQIVRIEKEYDISVKKVISHGECYGIFFETDEETYQEIRTNHQWKPLSTDRAFDMTHGSYIEGLQGSYVKVEFGTSGILKYIVLLDDNKTIVAIRCGAFW